MVCWPSHCPNASMNIKGNYF